MTAISAPPSGAATVRPWVTELAPREPCRPARAAALTLAVMVAASTERAGAAAPDDACALLSAPQASAAVGVEVDPGERVFPSSPGTCVWKQRGRQATGYAQLTVNLTEAAACDLYKAPREGVRKTPERGVGDDAYFVELANPTSLGGGATLSVKKGALSFTVLVIIPRVPAERLKAAEKAAALQILSRL